jgi:hypothetical protein
MLPSVAMPIYPALDEVVNVRELRGRDHGRRRARWASSSRYLSSKQENLSSVSNHPGHWNPDLPLGETRIVDSLHHRRERRGRAIRDF